MAAGNERKCMQCHGPIRAERSSPVLSPWRPDRWAAWLAGFCSAACQMEHAIDRVSAGMTWWQKGEAE